MRILVASLLVVLLNMPVLSGNALAETFNLSVQPVLPRDQVQKNYKPLADYLSKKTGHRFQIVSYRNFFTYWSKMQRAKKMHFILDAAHFTDYRIQKKKYQVLAKIPDTVSFTVVTGEDNFVFEMEELVSKRIATMASPGLGAVRLGEFFPNPVQLPIIVDASNSVEAANKVIEGKADAAIIPSPLVGNFPQLNTIVSTDPVPHMAISASSEVPDLVKTQVKKALIDARNTPDGQKMLEKLNLPGFEDTNAKVYAGFGELLSEMFGY